MTEHLIEKPGWPGLPRAIALMVLFGLSGGIVWSFHNTDGTMFIAALAFGCFFGFLAGGLVGIHFFPSLGMMAVCGGIIEGLDSILCPSVIVIDELTAEDWQHNVNENFKCDLFHDPEYLLGKGAGSDRVNVLALMQNPTDDEFRSFSDDRFSFRGFDLVELQTGISALANCGGFPKAFSSSDLSPCGLLIDHAKAMSVRISAVSRLSCSAANRSSSHRL